MCLDEARKERSAAVDEMEKLSAEVEELTATVKNTQLELTLVTEELEALKSSDGHVCIIYACLCEG